MTDLLQLMSLRSRSALVTGGGGHIGSVIVDALAELGANVAVLDLSGDAAEHVAARAREQRGVCAIALEADLADDARVREIPGRVCAELGSIDIVIHNAAFVGTSSLTGWAVPFSEQTVETWRAAMDVNLTAVFQLTQAALPFLSRSSAASVVNVASIYGMVGPDMRLYDGTRMGNPAAYAASKGGLIQLTRWMATVLAPGVRVNCVTPGGVERGQDPRFRERYLQKVPLGRMATEDDLKGAVAYLASDLSRYVTGHNLIVDGGLTAW